MSEGYVVVSIADNGVVHAWGDEGGQPFPGRSSAQRRVRELRRNDQELYSDEAPTRFSVCKILGEEPL